VKERVSAPGLTEKRLRKLVGFENGTEVTAFCVWRYKSGSDGACEGDDV
jgi:hypothetical protein